MKQFLLKNKVIISAVVAALILTIQPIIQSGTYDPKALALAAFLAVLGALGNQLKGKTHSIAGVIGAVLIYVREAMEMGHFTWSGVIGSAFLAFLMFLSQSLKEDDKELKNPINLNDE